MPTSIKVLSTDLDITQKRGKTTIAINTLYIEKGLQIADLITMFNQAIEDAKNEAKASIDIEAQLRIDADQALSRYTIDLETEFRGNFSSINSSLESITNSTQAIASDVETLTVGFEGLEVSVTNITAATAGYFTYWNSVDPLKTGMLKIEGGVTYQYVAGTWIRYDAGALGVANQVKGWVAGASSLVVNPRTGAVTGWSYGDGSGFSSFFTISASKINLVGETTFISNVVTGINNGTTTINGGKISTNSLSASSIAANTITADKIQANNIAVSDNFGVYGEITAIGIEGEDLTLSNTNSISTFIINNPSGALMKLLVSGAGRTGVGPGVGSLDTGSFGCWSNRVKVFDYGWTPMIQDSKAAAFSIVIPAGSSATIDVRGCKTSSAWYVVDMQFSTLGIRN